MKLSIFLVVACSLAAVLVWPAVEYTDDAHEVLGLVALYAIFIHGVIIYLNRYLKERASERRG